MEKLRSKKWIGNIYHKFEAMCQEVDGFVTKDTVKYVENQVQTVGQSVKKLYSGVVPDFLIPIDDPAKREAQAVNGKQKCAVGTCTSAVTGTTQDPVKEQSLNQDADNFLESHNASTLTEVDSVVASEEAAIDFPVGNDSATATYKSSDKVFEENITREDGSVDKELSSLDGRISSESCCENDSKDTMCYSFSDDEKCFSDLSSSQIILKDDIVREEQPLAEESSSFVDNLSKSRLGASNNVKIFDSSPDAINCISTVPSSQMVLQRNFTREVRPVTDQSFSFGDIALSKPLPSPMEESQGNSSTNKFPHPTSLHDTELGTFTEDERGGNCFSDAAEHISRVSIAHMILQDNITSDDQLAPKESSSTRDKSLPQTAAFESDTPPPSLHDAGVGLSMTVSNCFVDGITCVSEKSSTTWALEDAPSTFPPSELVISRVLPENECMDVDNGVLDSSLLAESSILSTSSIGGFKVAESDSSISTGLSASLSTPLASANNVLTVIPALLSAASLTDFSDVNASSYHESVGNAGSIENDLEWCSRPQLKALMCPAEIGRMNDCSVDLPGMETIDLTDKEKLEGSCVLVDNKLHNTISFRPRKYKSYKELLQEAFASRKRLIKEYKQLAVLYADVDAETSQHAELSQFPSLPLPCLHSTELAACNICESEWELL